MVMSDLSGAIGARGGRGRDSDEVTWEMEYVPDDEAHPLARPFSCITYGKVPPGYIETIPAQPLTPERVYTVRLQSEGGKPMSWVYFIIRADSTGRLTQLEASHARRYRRDDIHIITQE